MGHLGAGTFVVAFPECSREAATGSIARLLPPIEREIGSPVRVTMGEAGEGRADDLVEALLSRANAPGAGRSDA